MTWRGTGMWRKTLLLKDPICWKTLCPSVWVCACDTCLCAVMLRNSSSSFLGLYTAWVCHFKLILISTDATTHITSQYTKQTIVSNKCPFQGVGWRGGQFSDRCLYTTYRCRRNSEWLPWRLTTTHRSRQGNRKNIINKGTNNPNNKRNLNAPPLCPMWHNNLIAAELQLRMWERGRKGREDAKVSARCSTELWASSQQSERIQCSREQKRGENGDTGQPCLHSTECTAGDWGEL